jgi:hypothetical protein
VKPLSKVRYLSPASLGLKNVNQRSDHATTGALLSVNELSDRYGTDEKSLREWEPLRLTAKTLGTSASGRVSRAPRELSAARNCTRDEGGPFEFGDQEPISSHRKLLRAKAVVVSVAETPGQDFGRHGRERRAQANRCRSVESGLGDVRTGG